MFSELIMLESYPTLAQLSAATMHTTSMTRLCPMVAGKKRLANSDFDYRCWKEVWAM
jgi:hypothetical protein